METILLIEDDPREARSFQSTLAGEYRVLLCPEIGRAPETVRRSAPAAIVLSLPPSFDRREELIGKIAEESGGVPLLVLSREVDPSVVVDCLRSGASDFLPKPCDYEDIRRKIDSAIVAGLCGPGRPSLFIGRSAAIRAVEDLIRLYAGSGYPVLITGESGTGKEIAARALRDLAPRGIGSFVARNCAAIPEHLAESELFGTGKGLSRTR